MSAHLALSLLVTHRCSDPACARVIQQAIRILRNDTPHDLAAGNDQGRENRECPEKGGPPDGAGNTPDGPNTPSVSQSQEEVLMHMMQAHGPDEQSELRKRLADDAATIRRLQTLLKTATAQRDSYAARALHWFVAGPDGYCAACALPEENTNRHTPRVAA